MPRTAGGRNKGFAEKKEALLLSLTEYAINGDLRRPCYANLQKMSACQNPR